MNEIFGSGLLNAGLVDLDGSLLIQLVVFGIFFMVLNILVVKPMIAAHDARYEKMEGARKEAQSTDLKAARARAEYESNLDKVRQEAVATREAIRTDAQKAQRDAISDAQAEATTQESSAQDARTATREAAFADATKEAQILADAIVDRLIGKGGRA
jgi:F0F1-type ATP synthase membrane subunit b/b'